MPNASKTFLLTGGRSSSTLDIARQLHSAGHRVLSADTKRWHVCKFSNAVSKNFLIPSPRFETAKFIEKLVKITTEEKVDILIPTYEEILYLSKYLDRFPASCHVFSSTFETLHRLHNKWLFYCRQRELGIPTPKTYLVRSYEELKQLPFEQPYILKASYSRSSQSLFKIKGKESLPKIEFSKQNPWLAQEWLDGKKYCTYSVCQNGNVTAHATYPVHFTIDGNSCVCFEAVDHPKILEWVKYFAARENFTGQAGFDFFEMSNGQLYAIECNPRATNGLLLFQPSDRLDRAFILPNQKTIQPHTGYKKQLIAGMLLYAWKIAYKDRNFSNFLKALFTTRDVIFNKKDLKPFFWQPFIFCSYLYQKLKAKLSLPAWFTFDCNWDGEETGTHTEECTKITERS